VPSAAPRLADPRRAIRARRWRAFGSAALLLVALGAVAALLLAPARPGSVRVLGMALDWWVGGVVAYLVGLGLLALGLPGASREPGE